MITDKDVDNVYAAMEKYSKLIAIDFSDWKDEFIKNTAADMTTEQYFDEYLKHSDALH